LQFLAGCAILLASAGSGPNPRKEASMETETVQISKTQHIRCHAKATCVGPCPIHSPSDHHMRDWQLLWRDDRAIFERICEHGCGHPDPDMLRYNELHGTRNQSELAIHGCCGCCARPAKEGE